MSTSASFAYMQTRLQARHGMRPDERVWQQLQGTSGFANYLHAARRTSLHPWVSGLHPTHSNHEIEHSLRQQFRDYVDLVAHWLPAQWTGTIQWISLLPDLPAMQHLLQGEAAPAWMLNNPRLRPFTSENTAIRTQAMLDSSWREIVEAWQGGKPPVEAWLESWQHKWPKPDRLHAGMTVLSGLLLSQTKMLQTESADTAQQQRETLTRRLHSAFRRFSFQPAAACTHIALTALDLERLRADLVSRALFPNIAETKA